ncbi:MAG: S-adenosylmethionine:tRNA ribosyltransferase-isomerase [Candidatus Berkelbacteria bacterium Licking1014_96]|uniref:S-adenosylmethionine:tRNA ribosyltransferase-isomerase n=1 Tax=Candidatus Berkelbacteria bacterium Licking1014_96 TaxID=2017149 RepID=A0A554LGU2_9BACT|nr:MAG: S-adenosylmethionine:tRNA ribosyltransferase-isomerase [Candidatus Berkelbacteria bacterium Licking1014_96]
MQTKKFDYYLPKKLIAQKPISPRDHSRLLVLKKRMGKIIHDHFYNLGHYLRKGDVVVLNNTKVIPARLITDQGKEIFLLKSLDKNDSKWLCLTRCKGSSFIKFAGSTLVGRIDQKIIKFNLRGREFWKEVEKIGEVPTPSYVKSHKKYRKAKKDFYQTIFAKKKGSIAAPTAGFHFTQKLVDRLKKKGVKVAFITLHVGLGTFASIRAERVEEHQMHAEWFELSKYTADLLNRAKREGHRIVAVGTTAARVLESCAITPLPHQNFFLLIPCSGETKIFIKPGYKFKFVDALITNFHLPCSTPLLLASAFIEDHHRKLSFRDPSIARVEKSRSDEISHCVRNDRGKNEGIRILLQSYREAIKKKYRFYSFGDAMLIV